MITINPFSCFHLRAVPALDRWVRRFGRTSYALVVVLTYLLAATALGLAAAPALAAAARLFALAARLPPPLAWGLRGFALALGWFIFGLALLGVVALYNKLLPTRVRPYRGGYYTLQAVPWFLHNGLFYLVRFTFLPFATLTPQGVWFLRAMGMKIGRHAFINTEYISDPSLITIGDDAVVLPHSVLLPGSRVGPGETWGGVPARPMPREEMDRLKELTRGLCAPGQGSPRREGVE
jgi:hypothetical protein